MAVSVISLPLLQFLDDVGVPLAGAKLYSYLAATSTPAALYADYLGVTPLTNPAVADSAGKLLAYGLAGQAYKLNLLDANDVQQSGWPIDHITMGTPGPTTAQLLPAGLVITGTTVPFIGSSGDAQLIASGALPASALILLVQLAVTQQFGSGNGASSLAIGDAALTDRWGGGLTLAVGVKPLRNGGLPLYPSATDLILSIEGGVFDGSGAATATVWAIGAS